MGRQDNWEAGLWGGLHVWKDVTTASETQPLPLAWGHGHIVEDPRTWLLRRTPEIKNAEGTNQARDLLGPIG